MMRTVPQKSFELRFIVLPAAYREEEPYCTYSLRVQCVFLLLYEGSKEEKRKFSVCVRNETRKSADD